MQKIILFIEPNDRAFNTPMKIGNIFMNRFTVEEDASVEISKIFELCTMCNNAATHGGHTWRNFKAHKGMDDFIVSRNFGFLSSMNKNRI